jgi:hypothetical protein
MKPSPNRGRLLKSFDRDWGENLVMFQINPLLPLWEKWGFYFSASIARALLAL